MLTSGHPFTIDHAPPRPDRLAATSSAAGEWSASSSAAGAPALAAIDGSPATDWEPAAVHATLTAPVQGLAATVRHDHAAVGPPVAGRRRPEHPAAARPGDRAPAGELLGAGVEQRSRAGAGWRSSAATPGGCWTRIHLRRREGSLRADQGHRIQREGAPDARGADGEPLEDPDLGVVADQEPVGARLAVVAADLDVAPEQRGLHPAGEVAERPRRRAGSSARPRRSRSRSPRRSPCRGRRSSRSAARRRR